jgi:ABC-type polysaccharide/polyol phosphate transport system ATPase subunit
VHALHDLTVSLREGERVALIGQNGAGKTTLLRVLAGIYPCASGVKEVNGSVGTLLAANMALNSDATGYENIRLVSTLEGWPKERLDDYIADIEEFTELGEYLGLPLRVYSAGMAARLSFAMATIRAPDILLIDENIGAGDAQFQDKARRRVDQFLGRVKIIVIASHSTELLRSICTTGLLLQGGKMEFFGALDEALALYVGIGQRHAAEAR